MSQRRDKNLFNSVQEQDRRWRITQVKKNFALFFKSNNTFYCNFQLTIFFLQMKQGQYSELGNSQYQLMTSVSMPVYDLRHNEVRMIIMSYSFKMYMC